MVLRDCGPEYYAVCENYLLKCKLCGAGKGRPDSKVYFQTTEPSNVEHPYKYTPPAKKPVDKKKSALIKKSLKEEDKVVRRVARKTIASGRVYHDGDIRLLEDIKLEHKYRSSGSTFSVKKEEYDKMLRQGLDGLVITVKDLGTVYFLTEESYTQLLALAKNTLENQDGKIS